MDLFSEVKAGWLYIKAPRFRVHFICKLSPSVSSFDFSLEPGLILFYVSSTEGLVWSISGTVSGDGPSAAYCSCVTSISLSGTRPSLVVPVGSISASIAFF